MSLFQEPEPVSDQAPIYNSRILKNYVEYLSVHYPAIEADELLGNAGVKRYEVDDPAHWFNQEQVNRFHQALSQKTGDPNISREVGRFAAISQASSSVKKYALGFMNPHDAYRLLASISPHISKGFQLQTRKLGPNKVEVTATPRPGVREDLFQCQNRMGMFEALAKIFTHKLALVEHPTCIHTGGEVCRYILTWERTASHFWKRASRYAGPIAALVAVGLFFVLPGTQWVVAALILCLLPLLLAYHAERLEKLDLAGALEEQGDVAKERLEVINLHYNHARLVQEIGQVTSTIMDVDRIMKAVAEAMKKHMGFDRGMLMLADEEKRRLTYKAGYGYNKEQEELLRKSEFGVGNDESRGFFTVAFREQRPFLLDDVLKFAKNLSRKSVELAERMDVRSLICVPITYEKEALGLLAVDNVESGRPLTQTDVSLLMGLASQIAVGLTSAHSFHKLEESEKKYRELVENASSIILRLDMQGNILFFNEFAQRFFGHTAEAVKGRNAVGTILEQGERGALDLAAMIGDTGLHPGRSTVLEMEHMKADGETVWVAWTRRGVRDAGGQIGGMLCIGSDITPLKRAAEEKRDLEVRLQRAQKMEAIGTLAGGVAHDLNNILAGLVSYPELLLMDLPRESPLVRPLLTIKKSGERAASIVQDLLTLARRGVNTTEVVGLNLVIEDYLKSPEFMSMKREHPGFQVKTVLADDLFNIMGSPTQLSKTLMNLVINAAEAMPGGGTLQITTENLYVDQPVRGYDDVEEGDYVVLSVSDTGVGIPAKDLYRIFEPFYTKKVMGRSGTGLGMAVVWGTVRDHNGYIDVRSTEGQGTRFTLYFPVTRKGLPSDREAKSMSDYAGKGEFILVVDDVAEQREIASLLLTKLGYHVATVPGGEEAVAYVRDRPVELLILDMIMLPGIDGLETYRKIIQSYPGQKAIIVSGFSETERVREAQRLGVGTYLRKPYSLEKIGLAVRRELDRRG